MISDYEIDLSDWIEKSLEYLQKYPAFFAITPFCVGVYTSYHLSVTDAFTIGTLGALVAVLSLGITLGVSPFRHPKSIYWGSIGSLAAWFSLGIILVAFHQQKRVAHHPLTNSILQISIEAPPIDKGKRMRTTARITQVGGTSGSEWMEKRILLYYPPSAPTLHMGSEYQIRIQKLLPEDHFPQPYFRHYIASQRASGAVFLSSSSDITLAPHTSRRLSLLQKTRIAALKGRERAIQSLQKISALSPSERALIASISLGEKRDLSYNESSFRALGLSHLLSVSGFHVGIVFFFLLQIFRRLPYPFYTYHVKRIIILIGVWIFAFLSGLSEPTLRAVWMISLVLVGDLFFKSSYSVNTLAAVAFLLLLYNPFSLLDVGFQLSFLGVLSILWFMPVIDTLSSQIRNPLFRLFYQSLMVCLSAQILLFPIILSTFGTFPLVFPWSNLTIGLCASLLIPCALGYMLFSSWGMEIPFWGDALSLMARSITKMSDFFLEYFPYSLDFRPSWWQLILYYLALYLIMGYYLSFRKQGQFFRI